jgi:hypothetical protein
MMGYRPFPPPPPPLKPPDVAPTIHPPKEETKPMPKRDDFENEAVYLSTNPPPTECEPLLTMQLSSRLVDDGESMFSLIVRNALLDLLGVSRETKSAGKLPEVSDAIDRIKKKILRLSHDDQKKLKGVPDKLPDTEVLAFLAKGVGLRDIQMKFDLKAILPRCRTQNLFEKVFHFAL